MHSTVCYIIVLADEARDKTDEHKRQRGENQHQVWAFSLSLSKSLSLRYIYGYKILYNIYICSFLARTYTIIKHVHRLTLLNFIIFPWHTQIQTHTDSDTPHTPF